MGYLILIIAVVAADQIVKAIVSHAMALNESIPVIANVFHITYVQNTGAAFSLLDGFRGFLIFLPVLVIGAACVYVFRQRHTARPLLLAAVSLIVAGGLGNVANRIWLGYVVDYFDFRVFPVFNIADISICVGCGLFLIAVLFTGGRRKKET